MKLMNLAEFARKWSLRYLELYGLTLRMFVFCSNISHQNDGNQITSHDGM